MLNIFLFLVLHFIFDWLYIAYIAETSFCVLSINKNKPTLQMKVKICSLDTFILCQYNSLTLTTVKVAAVLMANFS